MHKIIHTKTLKTLAAALPVFAILLYGGVAFADSVKYSAPYAAGATGYTVDGDVTVNVNVAAVNALEITLSTSNLMIDLAPKVGTSSFGNDTLNILVGTTNAAGYTLTMEPSYNNTATTSLTRTESINAVVPTINTIDFATPATTFASASDTDTMNRWGYMLGTTNLDIDKTIYNPVLTNNTINATSEAVSNDPSSITFAAKANAELPAGDYRATLKFIAVANPAGTRITDLTYMQDFTTLSSVDRADVLNSMDLNAQYQLKDNRDNKKYWISKLETSCDNPRAMSYDDGDGEVCYQVWMTQNLDLNLETSPSSVAKLTSNNTDLNSCGTGIYTDGYTMDGMVCTFTPSVSTKVTVGETINSQTEPVSLDVGATYYYPGATSGVNGEQPASCPTNEICNHYLAGNYYNFTAAIASNDSSALTENYTTAANSICPAGWTLPTGMTAENGYSDFGYLLVKHGIASSYGAVSQNTGWDDNGYLNIQKEPLYIIRSGHLLNGGFVRAVRFGFLQSGANYDSTYNYVLRYGDDSEYGSTITPGLVDYKRNGIPVRCVLRSTADISNLRYMQDFASLTNTEKTEVLNSMEVSTATNPISYRLIDNRDNKQYWISKLRTDNANPRAATGADGNKYQIWMTQNLDLDIETTPNKVAALTSKNTDLNSAAGIYTNGYSVDSNGVIIWTPSSATATDVANTSDSATTPQSLDVGTDTYYYPGTAGGTSGDAGTNGDILFGCPLAENCEHWNVGNYYNFSAAVASNNSSDTMSNYMQMSNSICPAGWTLPTGLTAADGYSDFGYLLVQQGITSSYGTAGQNTGWSNDGYFNIQSSPLYIPRSGHFRGGRFYTVASFGFLQSGTNYNASQNYVLRYSDNAQYGYGPNPGLMDNKLNGIPVRCVVR